LIIGIGNLLLKDEGVGIHVVQELRKQPLPPGVEVCDGGVAGFGLLDLWGKAGKVVLIDAADMQMEPGAVARFTPDDVRLLAGELKLSAHNVGLPEVLALAKALDQCPAEVVIVAVQPKEISWGMDLTPEVQAAIPLILETVLKEIQ